MPGTPPVPRPALPACLGLLAGVCLLQAADPVAGPASLVVLFTVALRSSRGTGRSRVAPCLVFVGAALAGASIETADRQDGRRVLATLPAPGQSVEGQLSGRLLRAPEPLDGGERSLTLRHQPQPGQGPAFTVALRVAASPSAPTSRLDRLVRGDRVSVWCKYRRPRGLGNPGTADPAQRLRGRGIDMVGRVKSARLVQREGESAPRAAGLGDHARRRARRLLDRRFGETGDRRAILGAMLLGDRGGLPDRLERTMRDAGLIHLVAISGMHVGLLVVFAAAGLRRSRIGPGSIALLLPIALIGFVLLVGSRPPVLRAALGAALVLGGRALGREGEPLNGLALLASLLVLLRPGAIADLGFQLTFAATAGILTLSGAFIERIPLPRLPAAALAISTTAYLATAPLVAARFGRLAPIGLISNLLAAPLTAGVLFGGYGVLLFDRVPVLGPLATRVAGAAAGALLAVAEKASALGGSLQVPEPGPVSVAACYVCLVLALGEPSPGSGWSVLSRLGLGLTLVWLHLGPPPPRAEHELLVTLSDVGQGQAVLLEGPSGCTLMDTGGGLNFDPGERVVLPLLVRRCGRRLEALLLTHDHLDHAGGAAAILREFEVGELWIGIGTHRSPRVQRLAAAARERGSAIRVGETGDAFASGGVPFRLLGPGRSGRCESSNDRSLAAIAGRAPSSILIAGDLGRCGESEMLDSSLALQADALVLSHHGSRSGSSRRFLERVRPSVALVSIGHGNRFGHPHVEVLERLERLAIPLWRTDIHGAVRLESGDDGWQVVGHRPGAAPLRELELHEAERGGDEGQHEDPEQQ